MRYLLPILLCRTLIQTLCTTKTNKQEIGLVERERRETGGGETGWSESWVQIRRRPVRQKNVWRGGHVSICFLSTNTTTGTLYREQLHLVGRRDVGWSDRKWTALERREENAVCGLSALKCFYPFKLSVGSPGQLGRTWSEVSASAFILSHIVTY